MDNFGGNESERLGKRTADKIGNAVAAAGQKLDAAVDYVEGAKQSAKQTLEQVRQDGWEGTQAKAIDYARKQPLNALLIAAGFGFFFGLLMNRSRD